MIQIKSNKERDLDSIALEHFNGVLPIITHQINTLNGIPKNIKSYLTQPDIIKDIVISDPNTLLSIEANFKTFCKSHRITRYNNHLKRIFKYKTFSDKNHTPYNAYSLAAMLDVRTCPYCNRQYTFTLIDVNDNHVRPDFDHFMSQSDHPLLGLSFYNLIPSCLVCNRTLKHRKKFSMNSHIHPYVEGFGEDAKFDYFPHDHKAAIGLSNNLSVRFEFSADHIKKEKIDKNITVFKLDRIYQGHSDIVSEIIRKFYITNADYLRALHDAFPNIGTKDELYKLAFGNYFEEDQFEKRILSKLTKDIASKLGMLDYLEALP